MKSQQIRHLVDGGILGTFIDWRGLPIAHAAIFLTCPKRATETWLRGWGGKTRTQKCRRKLSL
jgi:hypothetical protein